VQKLAPEKNVHTIKLAMGSIRRKLDERADEPVRRASRRPGKARR
jgi:predicted DNA-binding helix-hairpin-helix protein